MKVKLGNSQLVGSRTGDQKKRRHAEAPQKNSA